MQAIGLDFLSGHRGMVRIADMEPPLSGDPAQGGVPVTSLWAYPAGPGALMTINGSACLSRHSTVAAREKRP